MQHQRMCRSVGSNSFLKHYANLTIEMCEAGECAASFKWVLKMEWNCNPSHAEAEAISKDKSAVKSSGG